VANPNGNHLEMGRPYQPTVHWGGTNILCPRLYTTKSLFWRGIKLRQLVPHGGEFDARARAGGVLNAVACGPRDSTFIDPRLTTPFRSRGLPAEVMFGRPKEGRVQSRFAWRSQADCLRSTTDSALV
jgi:hypothetical protein